MRWSIALVVVAGCAKDKPREAPRADAAPPKSAFRSVKAISDSDAAAAPGGLRIVFFEEAVPCESARAKSGHAPLTVDVPPGPADSYFVGTLQHAHAWTDLLDVHPRDVRLALDRFDPAPGAHLTGTLDIESESPPVHAHEKLDVEICEKVEPVGLPATVPDTPATGQWIRGDREHDITIGSALAFVEHGDLDVIRHIELYEAKVPCETADHAGPRIDFGEIEVAAPPTGVILPAGFYVPGADSDTLEAHAWIRQDGAGKGEMTFAVAVHKATGPFQVDLAGTIKVRLCP